MQENENLLAQSYKYLENVVSNNKENLKNVTVRFKKQIELLLEFLVVYQLIEETSELLHTLYDAIDQARIGKISSYLIKPDQFYCILQDIKSHLHIGDNLPIAVTRENIYN